MTSLLASHGKDVIPTPVPPSSNTENHSLAPFHPFPLLPQDLKIFILTFVAKASIEDPTVQTSPLTDTLPLVSRDFRDMCQSNCLWKIALEQLVEAEPSLWKEGLLKLHACEASSSSELVRVVHEGLREPGYFRLYRMVVARFLRFTSPIFCMTGNVRLGLPIGLHLFEPRYVLMIQLVMQGYPAEARDGRQIVVEDLPYFVYAHASPFSASSSACLVKVQRCRINENGTADVLLMPVAHIKMERLWVQSNTGGLHFAQCLRLGDSHQEGPSSWLIADGTVAPAPARRRFGSCPPCSIQ